jgi:Ran GTPase-activating protein (RanGAP) involved in mRNA processing and transport
LFSKISLWNCGLTDAQANTLLQVSNSNIREMFIDQNPGITETLFAGFIGEDSNIKTFSARSNSISDAGAKAIAAALKVNRSLTILNLWDNRIRRDGAEAIADVSFTKSLS